MAVFHALGLSHPPKEDGVRNKHQSASALSDGKQKVAFVYFS